MSDGLLDVSELDDYAKQMLECANVQMPREITNFLKREGGRLRTRTKAKARSRVKKKTGHYLEGIKRGRVYPYAGTKAIRVYAGRPANHAHLIEKGHRIVTVSNKDTGKKTKAYSIFEDAAIEFENQYISDAEEMVDRALDRGLG